ncbi:kinase-like protein [Diplodia corticola]|uniref:Kinase-like protein n=1 Tax=Diplodia corticola TaxID=236234 RepID=A0A1J9R8A4_9PEZI|nr:kinase-like protein [Diplodia corticola]OJD37782.1 kinase-like protein [Diplodia corticola]
MPSPFFRSPLDDTDTSYQSDTSAACENGQEEAQESPDEPDNVYHLARTKSTTSTSIEELSRSLPQNHVGGQIFDHREGVLHALLERNCLLEAVEELNRTRDPKHDRLYTKDDPEVKARAKANFFKVASSLAAHGISQSGLHRDEFKPIRDNYNQALDVAKEPGDGALQRVRRQSPDGAFYRSSSILELTDHAHDETSSPQRSPVRLGQTSPGHPPDILHGLVGNPHPLLPPSFSMASFYNLQIIGKGGYGTVFSGYHPLDGGFYAIKQIPLSASRMRNIRSKGQAELDAILKEVRSMQGFDHPNIVRYHSAWLERPSGNLHNFKASQKLLEFGSTNFSTDMESSDVSASMSSLEQTFESRQDLSGPDDGIVFGEDSAPGPTAYSGYHTKAPRHRRQSHLASSSPAKSERLDSELGDPIDFLSPPKQPRGRRESHNTLSSSVSKKSFVHSTDDEFDEEVERDFANLALSGPREKSFEMDMVFESDYHGHRQRRSDPKTPKCSDIAQVNLALHIQMALYPMTLADYLKVETDYLTVGSDDEAQKKTDGVKYRHCFHVKPSLQILLAILDGVQYLHARNMVHRDLKPANIFLSPCEQAYRHKGDVYLGVCKECAKSGPCRDLQMGVRIGDFGLVTELARPGGDQPHSPEKAVGTEFYRPPGPSRGPSEKLDVFSLGVIAFELLWKFDTKSERIHTLSELKLGRLPPLFAPKLEGCGIRIAELLQGMLRGDDDNRLSCAEVQKELEDIIASCDT